MFTIRPISANDLDSLMQLLEESGHGLTSLPKDRDFIANKIDDSERSFKFRKIGPRGESYLFVMEESETKKVVGVSGIISKIGGFEAYYFYRVKTEVLSSKMLKKDKEIQTLNIEKVHSGPAEICSLFLAPDFRNAKNGRFLSLSRFLYMAEHPNFFEKTVIAEMRGQVNEEGHSPFWDAVGNKFMDIEFLEADYLSLKSKSFIEELLPDYPLISNLLPQPAQDVIGEVHEYTKPARKILEHEGFSYKGLVGIFEPGPILEAKLEDVRAYKESRVISIAEISKEELNSETYIICNSGATEFKASIGNIQLDKDGKAIITEQTANALELSLESKIRYVSFK